MDGYELARRFAAHSTPERARGSSPSPATVRSRIASARTAAGFDAHLVKPVALNQLRRLVESSEAPQAEPPGV